MKKKRSTLTLAAALAAAVLAGCGSSTPSPSSQTADTAETAAEIEDQVSLRVLAPRYGPNTESWWADFQKQFGEDNPWIDLNVEVVPWHDIFQMANRRIAEGQTPDILNIDVFADFVADGMLVPARKYTSHAFYKKFYPAEKSFWTAVKPGVIRAQQQALLGGDVRELLDNQ